MQFSDLNIQTSTLFPTQLYKFNLKNVYFNELESLKSIEVLSDKDIIIRNFSNILSDIINNIIITDFRCHDGAKKSIVRRVYFEEDQNIKLSNWYIGFIALNKINSITLINNNNLILSDLDLATDDNNLETTIDLEYGDILMIPAGQIYQSDLLKFMVK